MSTPMCENVLCSTHTQDHICPVPSSNIRVCVDAQTDWPSAGPRGGTFIVWCECGCRAALWSDHALQTYVAQTLWHRHIHTHTHEHTHTGIMGRFREGNVSGRYQNECPDYPFDCKSSFGRLRCSESWAVYRWIVCVCVCVCVCLCVCGSLELIPFDVTVEALNLRIAKRSKITLLGKLCWMRAHRHRGIEHVYIKIKC